MDIISIFEKLAQSTHHQSLATFVDALPEKMQLAFLQNNSQQLRKLFSEETHFSDALTIAKISA